MAKLTIRAIAKMADVSPTAVSFVINGKKGVSGETRKKVEEIIKQTNFRPNLNSRRLSSNRSFNIAIIMANKSTPLDDLFYLTITRGVLQKSKEYGYNIVFTDISTDDNTIELPHILKHNDADGIIFYEDIANNILHEIDRLNIPYVIVDGQRADSYFTYVNVDYETSIYTATEYLIRLGHTSIGFIGSSYNHDYYLQAFTGFKNALSNAQLSLLPAWIQIDAFDEQSAYQCMQKILATAPVPSAIFCAGDIFAIGAMKCARDNDYNVPEDISFIGVDDIILSQYIEPALTTVKVEKVKLGILAMDLLVKKINGEAVESLTVEMNEIIIRDSVKRR